MEAVVKSNEIFSDDSTEMHSRPFGESSFSAVVSKGTVAGLHNAYIAVGTFTAAIFIVAVVVGDSLLFSFLPFSLSHLFPFASFPRRSVW